MLFCTQFVRPSYNTPWRSAPHAPPWKGGARPLLRVRIFLPNENRFDERILPRCAQTPYVRSFAFPVGDFVRGCETDECWTDARALYALDALASESRVRFSVDRAFSRADPRLCSERRPRHTGLVFLLGGGASGTQRALLRADALKSGLFSRVEPAFSSERHVVVSLCSSFPAHMPTGSQGVYALALQDALLQAGFLRGALTGRIDAETIRALRRFRQSEGLPAAGNVDRAVFLALTSRPRD